MVLNSLIPGFPALAEVVGGASVDVLYVSSRLREVFARFYGVESADIVFRIVDRRVREVCVEEG
jgi:hypothetical protein